MRLRDREKGVPRGILGNLDQIIYLQNYSHLPSSDWHFGSTDGHLSTDGHVNSEGHGGVQDVKHVIVAIGPLVPPPPLPFNGSSHIRGLKLLFDIFLISSSKSSKGFI